MDHTIARNRTKNAPVYRWRKSGDRWQLASGKDVIAEVVPYQDPCAPTGIRARARWQVYYVWPDPTGGNKASDYIVMGSAGACQTWAVRELRKFHNPPRLAGI